MCPNQLANNWDLRKNPSWFSFLQANTSINNNRVLNDPNPTTSRTSLFCNKSKIYIFFFYKNVISYFIIWIRYVWRLYTRVINDLIDILLYGLLCMTAV